MATKEEQIAKLQAQVNKIDAKKRETERKIRTIEKEGSLSAAARKERNHKVYLVGGAILELSKTDKAARNAVIKALEGIKKEGDKESVADLLSKLKAEVEDAKVTK